MDKLYFAHPCKNDKLTEIIRTILGKYFEVIDPFEENIGVPYEKIVEFNYTLIEGCDYLFAYIPVGFNRNIGTICEMRYAYDLGKIIWCLTFKENPFLDVYCTKVWYTWDEFINDI